MWTSVAVAGIGLAMTGVGAGLIIKTKDDTIDFKTSKISEEEGYKIEPKTKAQNNAYWGLLGAGIAATVVGVTLAGVFGYWYTHTNVQNKEESISFYSTINGLGLSF